MEKEKEKNKVINNITDNIENVIVDSTKKEYSTNVSTAKEAYNCLRKEIIIVRHVPKRTGLVDNPKHILYGGMAESATRTIVVPKLSSGMYVNVLTDNEKNFLEEIMGLEYNALSIYKKVDNFWDDNNDTGISKVRLNKQDNYLDLSSPEDYIKYKILLANKNIIAPSIQVLQDRPKATYQFVLIIEGEETKLQKNNMSITMQCYKEYGKIEEDIDILRTILETMDGRPLSSNTKLEFLQSEINKQIQANSKLFLTTITDPLLPYKVLIKKGIEVGAIYKKGDYLYNKQDNLPLCDNGEDPTVTVAARYLSKAKNQELKFAIEARINLK